ncbi:hypothetical protein SAMN04515671_2301 [Nakamurella panacisegetis]|uniref:Lipoprotein n=1 Tax=Nakamurella panacisegetis TaxID=1090615 RepID=A0A1H0NBJ6_9ACTN|nr:hypothetical protein [Nakamurella panacisegetis]SDO90144.1 hypothetical protein SAMN04515671_2301 [Nakamurella panacisegetis]
MQITIAAALGVALLITGCTSTGGTPSPGTSSVSSPAGSTVGRSTAASPSSQVSSNPAPGTTSSAPGSRLAGSSAGSSAATGSSAAGSGTSSSGRGSSGLDAQSTRWFDTLCTGFLPLADLSKLGDTVSAAKDLKTAQQEVVTLFSRAGASFTDTAKSLAGLPAPTIQGGAQVAAKVQPVLVKLGSTLTAAAREVAAVDVTTNPTELQTVLTDTATQISTMSSAVNLDSVTASPQAQTAIEAIPSCQKLSQLGT